MGNPHPTKSKPCKIGRRHTGEKSHKAKQKSKNGKKLHQRIKQKRSVKVTERIRDYWLGITDEFPTTD